MLKQSKTKRNIPELEIFIEHDRDRPIIEFDVEEVPALNATTSYLDLSSVQQFVEMSRYFLKECMVSKSARKNNLVFLVSLRLFLICIRIGIEIFSSFPAKHLMNAMKDQDSDTFWQWITISLVGILFYLPVVALDSYYFKFVEVCLRESLTEVMLGKYMTNKNYFRLIYKTEIDNPAQRITDDTKNLAEGLNDTFNLLVTNPIRILGFSAILYFLDITCVAVLLTWSIFVVTLGIWMFGNRLSQLMNKRVAQMANYRGSVLRVSENAESIGFYNAGKQELAIVNDRLHTVLGTSLQQGILESAVEVVLRGNWWLMEIFPYMLLASRIFTQQLTLGDVTQVVWAFDILRHALAMPLTHLGEISAINTTMKRIYELAKACDQRKAVETINRHIGNKFRISDLSYSVPPPRDQKICENLSLDLAPGSSMLIVGDSGCGKSSLMKTLSGLWSHGNGNISMPKASESMFLPQKPYMPVFPLEKNTLEAQLLFPWFKLGMRRPTRNQLKQTLEKVNLGHLLNRFSGGIQGKAMWHQVLSQGEQQRLAFARVLLANPKVVFLDESTSALDPENEKRMYQLLRQQKSWFVSIGHRKDLSQWHDQILRLNTDTTWRFISHKEYSRM